MRFALREQSSLETSQETSVSTRRVWATSGLLFVGSLLLRILYVNQLRNDPLRESANAAWQAYLIIDSAYYHKLAVAASTGEWVGTLPYFLAPLYSYFMAVIYAVSSADFTPVRYVQCALGAASCVLVYRIGSRLFSEAVGLLAGTMLALYSLHIYYTGIILPAVMVTLINLSFIWVIVAGRITALRTGVAGGILGLAVAAKPNAILLLPVTLAAIYWLFRSAAAGTREACDGVGREAQPGAWRKPLAAMVLGTLLTLAPFTLHNYVTSGEFVLMTTTGGRNFLKGNGPTATGTHVFLPDGSRGTPIMDYIYDTAKGPKRVVDESRKMSRQTWNHMITNPATSIRMLGKKFLLFFNARELFIRDNYYFTRRYSSLLRLPLFGFSVVGSLGLAGLFLAWKRDSLRVLLYGVLAAQVASYSLIFVIARYRLVSICLLMLFASHFVLEVSRRFREDRLNGLARPALYLAAAILLVHIPFAEFPQDRGFANQWERLGDRHYAKQERQAAIAAYSNALEADWLPDWPYPIFRVRLHKATIQGQLGLTGLATKDLRKLRRDVKGTSEEEYFLERIDALLNPAERRPRGKRPLRGAAENT